MGKRVKCVDAARAPEIIVGRVYEVQSETATRYYLHGIIYSLRKERFVDANTSAKKVRCVIQDHARYLHCDTIYSVIQEDEHHYYLEEPSDHAFPKSYFEDVVSLPPKTVSSVVADLDEKDKQDTINFFRTSQHPNECPCRSNYGTCPDHPYQVSK